VEARRRGAPLTSDRDFVVLRALALVLGPFFVQSP
jgi:hypothetical protein